jgi:hypothetical protein
MKTDPARAHQGPFGWWILDAPARDLLIDSDARRDANGDHGRVACCSGYAEFSRERVNTEYDGKQNPAENGASDNNRHIRIEGAIRILV